jgi:hypothetical protein
MQMPLTFLQHPLEKSNELISPDEIVSGWIELIYKCQEEIVMTNPAESILSTL